MADKIILGAAAVTLVCALVLALASAAAIWEANPWYANLTLSAFLTAYVTAMTGVFIKAWIRARKQGKA